MLLGRAAPSFLKVPRKGAGPSSWKVPPLSHTSTLSLHGPSSQNPPQPLPCRGVGPFLPLESLLSVLFSPPPDCDFLRRGDSVLPMSLSLPPSMQPGFRCAWPLLTEGQLVPCDTAPRVVHITSCVLFHSTCTTPL